MTSHTGNALSLTEPTGNILVALGEHKLTDPDPDPDAGAGEQQIPSQHPIVGPQREPFARQGDAIGTKGADEEFAAIEADQVRMAKVVFRGDPPPPKAALTPRMISDFCRLRLAKVLQESERSAVCRYLTDLLELLDFPPYRDRCIDWSQVAVAAKVQKDRLHAARQQLQPVFDAVSRAVAMQDVAPSLWTPPEDILTAGRGS